MRGLLLVAAILTVAARPADACECVVRTVDLLVPRDGAINVPTNARVLVAAEKVGEGRWAATDATQPPPVLTVAPIDKKGKVGAPVESLVSMMMGEADGTVYVVKPTKALKPNTQYALVKLEAPKGKKKSKKIAAQFMTFTTGAGADTAAPVFAGLERFAPMLSHQNKTKCHDTDPPYRQIIWEIGDVTDEGTAREDLIRILYIQRKGETRTIRLIEPATVASTKITGTRCDAFQARFEKNEEICAVVEIVDVAGNVAGATVEKCAPVKKM